MAMKPPLPNLETKALPPLPPASTETSPQSIHSQKRLSSQTIPTIVQPSPTLSTPLRREPEQNYARLCELYEMEKQKSKDLEAVREEFQQLEEEYMELEEKVNELRLENEALSKRILEMETAGCKPRPKGEDEYMSTMFKELRVLTETEILNLTNAYEDDFSLSPHEQEEILTCLSKIGDRGKKSAKYLRGDENRELKNLFSTGRRRNALFRHIVALYLVELVFKPYAFGLSREISDGMKFVEKDILHHGSRLPRLKG